MRARPLPSFLLACLMLLLGGCASTQGPGVAHDPWERMNRATYAFNETVDGLIIKPVAVGYDKVVPNVVQRGVSNFFSNIDDVFVVVNDLLQFKFRQGLSDTTRLVLNSTIGLAGLIDVATPLGLPKHNEDFGQTLGAWGLPPGPYLVLPILGPSTLRDTGGRVVDAQYSPILQLEDDERLHTLVVDGVSTRAQLLGASSLLETAALDPYSFTREAWLGRRQRLVEDLDNGPAAGADEAAPAGGDPADELDALDDLDQLDELDELDRLDGAPGAKPVE